MINELGIMYRLFLVKQDIDRKDLHRGLCKNCSFLNRDIYNIYAHKVRNLKNEWVNMRTSVSLSQPSQPVHSREISSGLDPAILQLCDRRSEYFAVMAAREILLAHG